MKAVIHVKRIYDKPSKEDGSRILVDRLWPRGIAKQKVVIDEWAPELAPTSELRKWFDHQPERWKVFQKKYKAELKENPAVKEFVNAYKKEKTITLLYAAKDEQYNHAIVLQGLLEKL